MRLSTLLWLLSRGFVLDSPYDFSQAPLSGSGKGTGTTGPWQLINDGEGVPGFNWPPVQSQSGERFQFINRVITSDLLTGGVAFSAPQVGVAAARINGDVGLILNTPGTLRLQFDFPSGGIAIDGNITSFKGIATVGKGVPALYGLDNRSGVTVADGSPIVLYTVPAGANQLFDAALEIDATAFTSGTATYTLTYTQNGVSQTIVVTATAINVVTGVRRLIQPDPSTNVTVQLTGVFTATCRLSAALMQLA